MRKFITAALVVALALVAGLVPAAANASTVQVRRTLWSVTGFDTATRTHIVWTRKLFATRAQADAYLPTVRALEAQVCPLAPASCAVFVEAPVVIGF